jgi:hypothetical protein
LRDLAEKAKTHKGWWWWLLWVDGWKFVGNVICIASKNRSISQNLTAGVTEENEWFAFHSEITIWYSQFHTAYVFGADWNDFFAAILSGKWSFRNNVISGVFILKMAPSSFLLAKLKPQYATDVGCEWQRDVKSMLCVWAWN